MIPMKQTVTIRRAGALDIWGKPSFSKPTMYPCRIDASTKRIVQANGQEVVATANILMKELVALGVSDQIVWSDELHQSFTKSPLRISIIRDFSGKPLFTQVVV
ncbi:hypothetical protein H1S01_17670 [Heliobacterium chlorum]|uniref:Uncharacterized protein n=1 Tax=Heliobacterium chlorum TaxID=2698 RepID=A0ABR7T697_HELCL|nr:hypothetical protein [Heliobacterium chlorum]MBC9786290.1 hypothetical protein [Heliobacterium chlorum]